MMNEELGSQRVFVVIGLVAVGVMLVVFLGWSYLPTSWRFMESQEEVQKKLGVTPTIAPVEEEIIEYQEGDLESQSVETIEELEPSM